MGDDLNVVDRGGVSIALANAAQSYLACKAKAAASSGDDLSVRLMYVKQEETTSASWKRRLLALLEQGSSLDQNIMCLGPMESSQPPMLFL